MSQSTPSTIAAPRLCILIPMYNAEATLTRTLTSLQHVASEHQSLVQVIVVNDGSRDGSLGLARSLASQCPAFQWDLIDKPNGGVASARNAGLARVRADWLFFLDADDELAANPLPLIDASGDATCIVWSQEIHGPGRRLRRIPAPVITSENRADLFTARCPLSTSSIIFRRSCLDYGFDEDIRYAEDWLFWNRNHRIFDHCRTQADTIGAIVHIHENNASTNYGAWGCDRAIVAGRIRDQFGDQLTRKQKNNLLLQQQMGRLQQRRWISPRTFLCFPCDVKLYLKLCVYAASALVGFNATFYRSSRPASKS